MKLILTTDEGEVIDSWSTEDDEFSLSVFDAVRQAVEGPTRLELGIMLDLKTREEGR